MSSNCKNPTWLIQFCMGIHFISPNKKSNVKNEHKNLVIKLNPISQRHTDDIWHEIYTSKGGILL